MIFNILLWAAFAFWAVQQFNDIINAFLNRENVPKLFWLSAGASLVSGLFLFASLYIFMQSVVDTFEYVSYLFSALGPRS